jgi:hypothetical protein
LTDALDILTVSIIRVITLMLEAASIFETLVNIYQIIRRNNPEDTQLQMTAL